MKHTKREWNRVFFGVWQGNIRIADCKPDGKEVLKPTCESECIANANLISAAPELLEALKQAHAIMKHAGGFADTVELAENAIRKATGTTN